MTSFEELHNEGERLKMDRNREIMIFTINQKNMLNQLKELNENIRIKKNLIAQLKQTEHDINDKFNADNTDKNVRAQSQDRDIMYEYENVN